MSFHTRLLAAFALAIFTPLHSVAVEGQFLHPGITHTQASIDVVKTKIAADEEPWASDSRSNRERTNRERSDRRRRRNRSSAHGTLMFANQPAKLSAGIHASTSTVVCFGDSITNSGYYKILGEKLGVNAINAGVGGNSTAKALRRLSNDVLKQKPDVVVILFGTNDLRADAERVFVPLDQYKVNLKAMVNQCRDAGAKVVLCTIPPIGHEAFFARHKREPFDKLGGLAKVIESYRDTASDVADSLSVSLVDLNRLLEEHPEWRSKDGVHPSEQGNVIIARHIALAVSPLLPTQNVEKAKR